MDAYNDKAAHDHGRGDEEMKYYLHKDGVLVGVGTCPDDELPIAPDGVSVGRGEPPDSLRRVEAKPREITYAALRRRDYPPITEYLDAVVKGDQEAVNAYIEKCLAVKAKYPKP